MASPSKSHQRTAWTIFVLIGVLVFALAAGWERLGFGVSTPSPAAGPQTVATVNGAAITQPMIDREVKISRLNVAAPLPPLAGEDLAAAREEALNQLVSRQLVLQAARRQGFALEESYIAGQADTLFGSYGDEALDQALANIGASRADLLWWVGEIFTVEKFITDVVLAGVRPDQRQESYNAWLNEQRAAAAINVMRDGEVRPEQALIGQPAPDFTLATLGGQSRSLADYRGQVVLVNFWATWCPSCITEMPDYEQVYREKQPQFVVLGVNLQESAGQVQQYAAGLGLSFPVLLDRDGTVTNRQYQVTGMPGSVIVDQAGRIHYRHIGPMSAETLRSKLAELGL